MDVTDLTRLFKSKRAVSPVIATVLMILIVMAGMTILFAFVGAYAQSFQTGSGSAVLESLTVEDAWFKNQTQQGQAVTQLQVFEYNIGKVELKITSVYVNDSGVTFNPNPLIIPAGGHGNFTITLTQPFSSNRYNLKIVTERGSAFEGSYSP
jgi:flagellin-like protein